MDARVIVTVLQLLNENLTHLVQFLVLTETQHKVKVAGRPKD